MLLATAVASHALSIGRVRGAAWIGQPLDVTVPVRLEPGEDGSSLCFDADVFHADTRVESRNVQLVTESAPTPSGGREFTVRVRSSLVVDEPVVTLYLRVGCEQKISRRLVLLADVPIDTSSAIPVAPLPVLPVPGAGSPAAPAAAPRPAEALTSRSTSSPVSRPATSEAPVAAPRPAPRPTRPRVVAPAADATTTPRADAPASAAPTARAPSQAPARAPAASPAPRARLQLDPAEPPPPPADGGLRSSTVLSGTPEENDARRAEAAAILRSINAQPDDIQRETQRLQELEKSLLALRSQMAQNQTMLTELRTQLDQAQRERYTNPLVYVLGLLLVLALAALAFVWKRGRGSEARPRSADWWRDVDHRSPNTIQVAPAGPIPGITEPPAPPPHRSTVRTQASATPAAGAGLDLDLGFDEPSQASAMMQNEGNMVFRPQPLPRRMHSDFHSSFGGSGRSVNTEELFDIHQQADFFVSLGQHEQAIGVLMGYIRENPKTSALAYLDLFRIYHQQNRRAQFDQLRDEFHAAFNADVPSFDAFNDVGRGLEGYAETLARIEALWGTPDGITLIEELIFRRPGRGADGQAFDLEAYRELLLLFAIALEVSESEEDDDFVVSGRGSAFAVIDDTPGGPATVPPAIDDEPVALREASVSLPPLPEFDINLASEAGSLPTHPAPAVPTASAPKGTTSSIDFELSDSMVAPLGSLPVPRPPARPPAPAPADNGIDFDLFDPSTEAKLDPERKK